MYQMTDADHERLNAILAVWEDRLGKRFTPRVVSTALMEMRTHAIAFILGYGGFPPRAEDLLSPTITPGARAVILGEEVSEKLTEQSMADYEATTWRGDPDFRAYLETNPITMGGFNEHEVDMVHTIAWEAWQRGRAEVGAWLRALADESERRATAPDGTMRDLLGGSARAASCRQLAEALDKRIPLHGIAVGSVEVPKR